MSVLVIAEQLRGQLRDVTRELVTAAQELEGPVALAVIAREPARIDAGIACVDEIVQVDVEANEFENDVYQEAVEALIRERRPHVVLAGFTVNSMGYAAAVAVKLGLGFASDVHALRVEDGELVATRSFYGAKVNGDVDFPGKEPCCSCCARRRGSPPTQPAGRPSRGSRSRPPVRGPATASSWRLPRATSTSPPRTSCSRIQPASTSGRETESTAPIRSASCSNCGIASLSPMPRPISNARQVGQSGKTVKAKVYLALGISGAVQHLAGMKTCGTIIAVNTDPEAAIFNVAHYGAVADLFDVAEELDKLS